MNAGASMLSKGKTEFVTSHDLGDESHYLLKCIVMSDPLKV